MKGDRIAGAVEHEDDQFRLVGEIAGLWLDLRSEVLVGLRILILHALLVGFFRPDAFAIADRITEDVILERDDVRMLCGPVVR